MVKIVGKILITFFCIIESFLHARIALEVRTDNGTPNSVVVGQPFTLDVVIDDVYGSVAKPSIKGLEKFNARQCGSYMSSVNGKATARYSYQVRIDKIGSYVLGPATVIHQQQTIISNELCVDVVKDIGTPQMNKNNNAETKTFLRLMVSSESVVVGQKIGCMLRFYYQDPSISLTNIGSPDLLGFDVKEHSPLEHGTAQIDGVEYHYAQWQWDMYPTKPGEFLIPAYNADYELPIKDNHLFGGFFMLSRADRKRIYSNALTLKVSPLPYSNLPVHAVGQFERFSAEIKPGMAKEGEGMVLTLEIEGNGNLPAIATPPLQMPDALKYYDSNSTIIMPKHSDELPKKRFEFIVQGMKSGYCEIPEQLFTYFDTETHRYETLRTVPLAVSIMSGTISVKQNYIPPTLSTETSATVDNEKTIADINTTGNWYAAPERHSLPWWLFQLLLLLPCFYMGYPFIVNKFILLTGNSARLRRWRAFRQAHQHLEHAFRNNDDQKLYTIFMQLLQELGTNDLSVFAQDSFFERMTHAAYGKSDNKNSDELCRMAKEWLERLEKIM
ncbi:MAG TPA: BatD family protein [Candidatus Babeliales bacterium]|nr:BatD family protein [Candidatus Babeliales bacterium]